MSNPLVILCPGQGAQVVGMGKAWAEKSPEAKGVFDAADRLLGSRLGAPLSEICFSGPADRLNQTDVSQPAIYVTSIACWRGLLASWSAGNGEAPLAAAAGLSLGEYTALCVAGSLSFEEGLELVVLRGRAMQDAAVASPGGMVALVGGDDAAAQAVCDEARQNEILVCANFNAPGQVVLSGHKTACQRAADLAGKHSLRATMLPVSGAFHSPLMAPAAEKLGVALAKTTFKAPRCPVVSNVTALPHAADSGSSGGAAADISGTIRRRLAEQLTNPVRWAQSCAWLAGNATGQSHELAPGRTLAGLMRRIDKSVKVESHDEP